MESIEKLLDEVEQSLRLKGQKEIKSWEVGNLIIERLRVLDKLSYLLFASVYRDFSSLEDFENELKELREAQDDDERGQGEKRTMVPRGGSGAISRALVSDRVKVEEGNGEEKQKELVNSAEVGRVAGREAAMEAL
jgi:hypothetical protein